MTPTYNSGTIYGSGGGFASYSGTSYTTSYVPYSVARYDYLATYWVKMKPPRLGIYCKDLTDELRQKLGSNKGVYIAFVVKDSPAFNSDLLVGDVIRRVNDTEVISEKQLANWLDEKHPSEIEFAIYRNGENINKKVQVRYSDAATDAGPTEGHSQPTTTDQKSKTNEVTNTGQTGESVQSPKTDQNGRKVIGWKRAPDDAIGSEHAKWIPVYESK
jgi:membrane-associated protease RseP (regulator of RpoE activity)